MLSPPIRGELLPHSILVITGDSKSQELGSIPSGATNNTIMKYLNKLINNNTGVSSKNFLVVTITIISLVLLLIPAIILLVEIIYNHTILTDLSGLS